MTRSCGPCTACCTALNVHDKELMKARNERCQHLCDSGCSIYERRPVACANFACAWLKGWGDEHDRPDNLGAVLEFSPDGAALSCAPGVDIDDPRVRTVEAMLLEERHKSVQVYDRNRARITAYGKTRSFRIIDSTPVGITIEQDQPV